jgi:hypothetical protein
MKNCSLSEAQAIAAQMPYSEAERLPRILTLPCNSRRRARLIARPRLSLGSLIVADTFDRELSDLRRWAGIHRWSKSSAFHAYTLLLFPTKAKILSSRPLRHEAQPGVVMKSQKERPRE